jgi:hypothetical protein
VLELLARMERWLTHDGRTAVTSRPHEHEARGLSNHFVRRGKSVWTGKGVVNSN